MIKFSAGSIIVSLANPKMVLWVVGYSSSLSQYLLQLPDHSMRRGTKSRLEGFYELASPEGIMEFNAQRAAVIATSGTPGGAPKMKPLESDAHKDHEIIENQALGKTFKVCRTCQVEVEV